MFDAIVMMAAFFLIIYLLLRFMLTTSHLNKEIAKKDKKIQLQAARISQLEAEVSRSPREEVKWV